VSENLDLQVLTRSDTDGPTPPAMVGKFTAQGEVLACPGNTTLCHVQPESAAHKAITELQNGLKAGPVADAFAFLPPASFHMTVFNGVIVTERDAEWWPDHVPDDVDAATEYLMPRFQSVEGFSQVSLRPTALLAGHSLRVSGATDADEAVLRATRDRLAAATGLHRKSHASYPFHITLAYPLRWLTEPEAQAVSDLSQELFAELLSVLRSFPLGPVEICRFETMHRFDTLGHVGGG